jgi:hypothetical protein
MRAASAVVCVSSYCRRRSTGVAWTLIDIVGVQTMPVGASARKLRVDDQDMDAAGSPALRSAAAAMARRTLFTALAAACLLGAPVLGSGHPPTPVQRSVPDGVLDGTDVRALRDFPLPDPPATVPRGAYVAETGGAASRVAIRGQAGKMTITRTFEEPGIAPSTRRYSGVRQKPDGTFGGTGVTLRPTRAGGILLLERASGVDGIPSSLWIHYVRQPPEESQ